MKPSKITSPAWTAYREAVGRAWQVHKGSEKPTNEALEDYKKAVEDARRVYVKKVVKKSIWKEWGDIE